MAKIDPVKIDASKLEKLSSPGVPISGNLIPASKVTPLKQCGYVDAGASKELEQVDQYGALGFTEQVGLSFSWRLPSWLGYNVDYTRGPEEEGTPDQNDFTYDWAFRYDIEDKKFYYGRLNVFSERACGGHDIYDLEFSASDYFANGSDCDSLSMCFEQTGRPVFAVELNQEITIKRTVDTTIETYGPFTGVSPQMWYNGELRDSIEESGIIDAICYYVKSGATSLYARFQRDNFSVEYEIVLDIPAVDTIFLDKTASGRLELWLRNNLYGYKVRSAVSSEFPEGSVLYWPFDNEDGLIVEGTENEYDLELQSYEFDPYGSYAEGILGNALRVYREDQTAYLHMYPYDWDNELNPTIVFSQDWSAQFWIKDFVYDTRTTNFGLWFVTSGRGFGIDIIAQDEGDGLKINFRTEWYTSFTGGTDDSGYIITPTEGWNHFVFTRESSTGRIILYMNGEQVYSSTFVVGPPIAPGSWGEVYTYIASASLDEMGVWDRVLTEEEVKNLYNNGQGLPHPNAIS